MALGWLGKPYLHVFFFFSFLLFFGRGSWGPEKPKGFSWTSQHTGKWSSPMHTAALFLVLQTEDPLTQKQVYCSQEFLSSLPGDETLLRCYHWNQNHTLWNHELGPGRRCKSHSQPTCALDLYLLIFLIQQIAENFYRIYGKGLCRQSFSVSWQPLTNNDSETYY